MAKFSTNTKVVAVDGLVGKVIYTDSARKLVAVEATEDGVGHSKGTERVYKESEVRKN